MKIGRVKKKQFQISFSNVILRTMLRSSSISAMRWPELVKNNFHITTRFCKDVLDSTSDSKKPNFSNGIWIWMKLHVYVHAYIIYVTSIMKMKILLSDITKTYRIVPKDQSEISKVQVWC
jgi:hypothetical protein